VLVILKIHLNLRIDSRFKMFEEKLKSILFCTRRKYYERNIDL